ncbi:hypothetical protein MKX08_002430 [Trichoderma sp. CBMAI-0020]|nr:hypothetical protein MKX08_002430 [Trichoderma sp. CBMAI-0020]
MSSTMELESVSSVAEEAFQAASERFTADGNQNNNVKSILRNATSLKDIQETHEKTIELLAKFIAQISESLPRAQLSSDLYPTPQMKVALEELYALVLNFLVKAYDWYKEEKLSHFLHSVTRPLHRVYADLVAEIAENSRKIDQLAAASMQ